MPQEKIKSPAYKDVSIKTTVGYLPHIINSNNAHTKELFENICTYTDSSQYVKIPVITKSLVKGNSGHFNNLYISGHVHFDASLSDMLQTDFTGITTDHRLSLKESRFSEKTSDIGLDLNRWTHDAWSIYYNDSSSLGDQFEWMEKQFNKIIGDDYMSRDEINEALSSKIDISIFDSSISNLQNNINELEKKVINHLNDLYINLDINKEIIQDDIIPEEPMPVMFRMTRSLGHTTNNIENVNISNEDFINVYKSVSTYYTYPINLYTSVPTYSDKHYKTKSDYYDVKNGIKFKYYNVNNCKYVKIDNEFPVTLHGNLGDEIDLIIDKKIDKDINIKLSSSKNSYSYVNILADDINLVRMTLICVDYSDIYGSTWYVKNYAGNIHLK